MMADRQSYPSPTAAQTRAGVGPFYGNNGASSLHENKDMPVEVPQMHLEGNLEHFNPELQANGNHDDSFHERLAQSVMSLANHQPDLYQPIPTSSSGSLDAASQAAAAAAAAVAAKAQTAAQRSKVSRACDECRRKKVSFSLCQSNRGSRPLGSVELAVPLLFTVM